MAMQKLEEFLGLSRYGGRPRLRNGARTKPGHLPEFALSFLPASITALDPYLSALEPLPYRLIAPGLGRRRIRPTLWTDTVLRSGQTIEREARGNEPGL